MPRYDILSIDPGWSTGYVWGYYSEQAAYQRESYGQIDGGVEGFINWWRDSARYGSPWPSRVTIVFEQFVLLNTGHTLRSKALEALRVEGAIKALKLDEDPIVMQRASAQLLAGGNTPRERKKNSDHVLRANSLWLTGSDVSMKDADDVISAQKHALHYMIHTLRHKPTIERYLNV